jgi:hypothetical protein
MNSSKYNSICPLPETLISVMIDGEGTDEERDLIAKHVTRCASCESRLEPYYETRAWIARARRPPSVFLNRDFTANTMELIRGDTLPQIWDDVLKLSKKAVTVFGFIVAILITIMMFPENQTGPAIGTESLISSDGTTNAGEIFEANELTHDDVVALILSGE